LQCYTGKQRTQYPAKALRYGEESQTLYSIADAYDITGIHLPCGELERLQEPKEASAEEQRPERHLLHPYQPGNEPCHQRQATDHHPHKDTAVEAIGDSSRSKPHQQIG
jgi:hypothetical protein